MALLGDIADFGKDVIENRDKWADRFQKVGDFIERNAKGDKLERVAKVGRNLADFSKQVTDFFESSLGKRLIRSAKSPILAAGQHVISSMKLTTGVGDPENGERFGQGADRLGNAGETLNSAFPDDSWDSGGSGAYTGRNTEQVGRSETMINADRRVATVLSREAGQIAATRENLDGQSDWLADMSLVTLVTGCIPYVGKAAQISAEIAMVTKAVGESTNELTTMQRFASANAAELQDAVSQYAAVAQDATPTAPDRDFPPTTPTDGDEEDEEKDPEEPGDTPRGESLAGPSAPGAPGPGTPAGGGGGAPTPQSAPAAPSMPSGLPSGPQPAAAGGDMTGAMMGAMGSVLGSLGGILGGVAQAAQVAAQAATRRFRPPPRRPGRRRRILPQMTPRPGSTGSPRSPRRATSGSPARIRTTRWPTTRRIGTSSRAPARARTTCRRMTVPPTTAPRRPFLRTCRQPPPAGAMPAAHRSVSRWISTRTSYARP